jgi:hypothetical protein
MNLFHTGKQEHNNHTVGEKTMMKSTQNHSIASTLEAGNFIRLLCSGLHGWHCNIMKGKFPQTVSEVLLQTAVGIVHLWCDEDTSINLNKTKWHIFPRREIRALKNSSSVKQYSCQQQSKILWTNFGQGTNMNKQMDKQVGPTGIFDLQRYTFREMWGLNKSRVLYWIHTIIHHNYLCCLVSNIKTQKGWTWTIAEAGLGITGAMWTIPTVTAKFLLGLSPLHLMMDGGDNLHSSAKNSWGPNLYGTGTLTCFWVYKTTHSIVGGLTNWY